MGSQAIVELTTNVPLFVSSVSSTLKTNILISSVPCDVKVEPESERADAGRSELDALSRINAVIGRVELADVLKLDVLAGRVVLAWLVRDLICEAAVSDLDLGR
jgi:hypothetical protein